MEHNTMQRQVILDKWMGLRAVLAYPDIWEQKKHINKVIKVKGKTSYICLKINKANNHLQDVK